MSNRTLVVIPTYNERPNIEPLLTEVLAIDHCIEVLVIDDGSPDGTGETVDRFVKSTPRVHAIHRAEKLGLGSAYLVGFQYALEHGYDYVIEMDADFSHRPQDIPELLLAARDADVAIGSRNIGGAQITGWSPLRYVVSKAGSLYARLLLGLQIRDCTAGFKCFRRSALEAVDFSALGASGYGFQVEVNFACARQGLRMVEVPVVFPDRVRGESKMSIGIVAEAALLVLRLATIRLSSSVRSRISAMTTRQQESRPL